MGAISCDRNNCDNVMCDTHIDAGNDYHGIDICNECIKEFKRHPYIFTAYTDDQIKNALVQFMHTSKAGDNSHLIDDFFKRNNTRRRYDEEE